VALKRWENIFKRKQLTPRQDEVTSPTATTSPTEGEPAHGRSTHVKFQEPVTPRQSQKQERVASHYIHSSNTAGDVAKVERQFETLCSQYSTCYVSVDEDDDIPGEVGDTSDGLSPGQATPNSTAPAGFSGKRGMSMMQRQQTIRAGTEVPPPLPPLTENLSNVRFNCLAVATHFFVRSQFNRADIYRIRS
jgi:hypothetical protein